MSRLYLGYCLENELNQNIILFSTRCAFFDSRWHCVVTSGDVIYHPSSAGDLGAVLGASASIRGYIQQKQLDFQCLLLPSSDTATNARSLGSIIECPCMRIGFMGSCVPMNARDLVSSLGVCTCS